MIRIAFIDIMGSPYDGLTVYNQGLGGSESAVVFMAKELAILGFEVTVFNNCTKPGTYDFVKYYDLYQVDYSQFEFDVVISSRSIIPFVPEKYWTSFNPNPSLFLPIVRKAKFKAVWMHDTFCSGDQLLEEILIEGHFDEVFTLSDFHTSYVTTCSHGKRRNFEVIKNKIFMTRNGINKYLDEVDISQKDKNLFVFNASVTKGMIPLVESIWPRLVEKIPQAKLKIIGGYYNLSKPDEQQKKFEELRDSHTNKNIEFTGVIKQSEIANILAKASFMIYPGAFPETSGISTLESLYYNTPLITTRFGALEETAVEQACYLLDYAIVPNSLYDWINKEKQFNLFVDMAVRAYNDPYLHQQKMYYCNIINDICGWNTVALQWKQHLFKKLGKYIPIDDYRKVSYINDRVHKVYGRRFSNAEEWNTYKRSEKSILIVSPFFNAESYISKCIESVCTQDYDNYTHVLVDDGSTDNSYSVAKTVIEVLSDNLRSKFVIIKNNENKGAIRNQYETIKKFADTHEIVILLDADDSFVNDNNIFNYYNNLYHNDAEFTYGSCWSMVDNIPLIAQPYPEHIKKDRKYRDHKFNWNIPYTHTRTFKSNLINLVDEKLLKGEDGNWFKAGGDVALFYALIEKADPNKVMCVQDVFYLYNDKNPLNDYKVNSEEQTKNANYILRKKMKNILIAIPTAKYIEPETFKSVYDLQVPDGYKTTFQYFYGYNIDQVRNLIAHWAERYDYLFSVDSDITFAPDTLTKLLSHDKDMVSGLYIQRNQFNILEIYKDNDRGGNVNIPYMSIKDRGLVEVSGCGFGCVLVKSEVIRTIGYPQFVYTSAIDHKNTISEDIYFCRKARERGFKIYADTSILCEHIGTTTYKVQ